MTTLMLDIRANGAGIARYGRRLLTESAPRLGELADKVYAVAHDQDVPELALPGGAVELVTAPSDEGRYVWRRDDWLRELVADVRPNLFYTTNYTMDADHDGPFVVTIHDLVRLMRPETASDAEFVARYGRAELARLREVAPHRDGPVFAPYFAALTGKLASRASLVATVSAATAKDIRSVLGVPADRISIVPSAVDEVFRPRDPSALRRRFSLGDRYFLFVGVAGNRKKVDWLIRSFGRVLPRTQLVVAGGDAEYRADIRHALADAGPVVFTGRISDEDLAALYTGAVACLSASAQEGFDLPPAEAMACGSEAIVTAIPAHREVLGRHAHYFPVGDEVRFGRLVTAAFEGRLPRLAPGYAPPTWQAASRAFLRTIERALR
ncbi:MAG TPA: glycosyltransferase family 1 protein [Pseudonocardiaceae bacterium]|jgi:glycosyltransferase involved in cell wall biosynthesis